MTEVVADEALLLRRAKKNAYMKKRRDAPGGALENRNHLLKWKYGITHAQYEEMLAAQGGGCAICGGTKSNGHGHHLCIDHDHVTGAVRGLLCSDCNKAVGFLKEDPALALSLIEYLRVHKK